MKRIALIIVALMLVFNANAQNFEQEFPDDFMSVGFQIDPNGSIDKGGLNSVLSFQSIDFGFVEWEVQIQTIFTSKYSRSGSFNLDYIDFQWGPGILIPLGNRSAVTAGAHIGMEYRPRNKLIDNDRGGMIYGPTGKFRHWLGNGKRIAIVMSCSYDRRSLLKEWIFNGRGGLEFRID